MRRFSEVLAQITAKPPDDFLARPMRIHTCCTCPRVTRVQRESPKFVAPLERACHRTGHKMNYRDRKPRPRNGGTQRADGRRLLTNSLGGAAQRLPIVEFNERYASTATRAITPATPPRRSIAEALDSLQLLTVTDVCKLLRISKPTLWRIRRSGDFPDPTTVTERIFGWRRSEIDGCLASRPNSRRY